MKKLLKGLVSYGYILIMAAIILFPFIYMIASSLMTYQEATSIPPTFLPAAPQFSNYGEAMEAAPFARYFVNTVFVGVLTTLGTLTTTILAGFAIRFLNFKGKRVLMVFLIALMMLPFEVVIFTNYNTIAKLGLIDTYTALIIPFLASVAYIFYLRRYLQAIPQSYYDAAKMDGCGDLEFIFKIMVPMSKNALFTIALLSFIATWNSFLWPIMVTNSTEMRLISNGLSAFTTESGSAVQLQMAASTLTIVPILIIYFIFRDQIIEGVTRSGTKG